MRNTLTAFGILAFVGLIVGWTVFAAELSAPLWVKAGAAFGPWVLLVVGTGLWLDLRKRRR